MIDYREFRLDNGLRIAHHHDPSTAMVALNLVYATGSRHEDRRLTGIAHLFEHLMFGGSASAPDFDGEMHRAGGVNNAWTSTDFTCFYDLVPAVNAATAFFLESDRMLALNFSPEVLRVQQSVVIEEFKQQCLNQPYGDLYHLLRANLYSPDHPYSWPVIGLEPDHIRAVTEADTRRWFYSHYAPNNAVLAVAGNIDFDRCRQLAGEWFGRVPARQVSHPAMPDPGFPTAPVTVEARGHVPATLVVVAIPIDPYGTRDNRTADVITDLLANGRSARMPRRLVMEGDGLIASADAAIIGSEHDDFMILVAQLATGRDSDADVLEARSRMLRQAALLARPGQVTPRELERSFNRFEANYTFENMTCAAKARTLATALMHGEDPNRAVERHRSVTEADIARVADKLFNHTPALTLNYRPAASESD